MLFFLILLNFAIQTWSSVLRRCATWPSCRPTFLSWRMNWAWWWAWRLWLRGEDSSHAAMATLKHVHNHPGCLVASLLWPWAEMYFGTVTFEIGFQDLGLCSPYRKDLPLDITALAQEVFDILRAPARPALRTPESQRRKKSQFFINSSSKKAKSVTLHIQGLDSTVSGGGGTALTFCISPTAEGLQVNGRCSFVCRTSGAFARRRFWRSKESSALPSRWPPRDAPSASVQTFPQR